MTVYNSIGQGYNQTRKADPYLAQTLHNLLQPKPYGIYLDIGCGTGNYTIALAEKGVMLHGVDPSEVMLNEAKAKSNAVQWHLGSAEQIPFNDDFFDGAIATLTLHHWDSLEKGFKEIHRVMKPNTKMVVFAAISDLTEKFWLQHYFPKMSAAATRKEPKYAAVENAVRQAGFKIAQIEKYFIQDDLQDQFLYAGKNNPKLYLNPNVRSGISSFAQLSLKEEVEQGLKQLKADIESGNFENISKQYPSEDGDYMFIVLEK
jgi:ubiquinone/menaquinone biosynthesis C-methylase UbiE